MAARGTFNNKLGFILAAAGSAVGLGNIWKFPFEVSQGGGGIFVIMYLFFCFILAFPILVSEVAIGRKTRLNPISAMSALNHKKWSFIGYLGIACSLLIISYYNVVAGWAFGYFIKHVGGIFPDSESFSIFVADWELITNYSVLFMLFTCFIVSRGVAKGIERAGKILMPSLLLIMLFLTIYAFTLEGSLEGVKFYLFPNFENISLETIKSALGQSFFSLSLGMGTLITFGSYLPKRDNILSSAMYITLADVGIAFLAGLMIFPIVFSMGDLNSQGGAGLIFSTLPTVFKGMGPVIGLFIGSTFFLLLSFAALTSTVSLLEVPVSYLIDQHKFKRMNSVLLVGFVSLILGIPSLLSQGSKDFFTHFVTYPGKNTATSFLDMIDEFVNSFLLPFGGVLICIFTAYIWGKMNLNEELSIGFKNYKGSIIEKLVNWGISYFCPIILIVLLFLSVLETYFGIKLI